MPSWGLVLFGVFLALGLRMRPTWNVNAIAAVVTTLVIIGVAAKEHLI